MLRRNVLLALVGAFITFALVAASPAVPLTKPMTLQMRGIVTGPPIVVPDADGDGQPALGDSSFMSMQLVNDAKQLGKKKGAKVGQASVVSWIFAPGLEIGLAAASLPNGLIMSSGYGSLTKKFTAAVIGGTGAYSNVSGTITGTPVSQTEMRLVLKLMPTGK